MKIITFEWDNAKGESHNGKSLCVGQFLNKIDLYSHPTVSTYGISISIIDTSKDFQLKRFSHHSANLSSEIKEITKEEALILCYDKIKEALDILYNETEMKSVDQEFNTDERNGFFAR